MPETDEIPGLASVSKSQPSPEIPWREVEVEHFKTLKGKKLGELTVLTLEKVRDTINGMSVAVRSGKTGIGELLAAVNRGLKELSAKQEPVLATPVEGLRNLAKASGVSEQTILEYAKTERGWEAASLDDFCERWVNAFVTAWPDVVGELKGLEN